MIPDTYKQQHLARQLARHGHPEGWRAWLLARRAEHASLQALTCEIHRDLSLTVDPTTLALWIKQADTEARHAAKRIPPEAQKAQSDR